MSMVWVVLGECGEYSDRSVWVSGIFVTEKEAQDAVIAASERERVYTIWYKNYRSHLTRLRREHPFGHQLILWAKTDEQKEADAGLIEKAKQLAGPEPEYERGERWEIEVVELGKWQR